MITPLQVIHQVQEGQAPANWCVLRPVRFFGPIASFILGGSAGMLFMLYGTLFVAGATQPARLHQNGAGPFGQPAIVIPMALLSLTISSVIALMLNRHGKRKSDALLVLMPEGVVSCERLSNDAKRSYYVIEYANIRYIMLTIEAIQSTRRVSLTLQYRNGSSETCRVSNTYRSPEWIARHIIGAHLRFKESSPLSSP
jgi:hypothetical protein